jgi:hypothetical protein
MNGKGIELPSFHCVNIMETIIKVIGKVKKGSVARVLTGEGKKKEELHPVSRDEILKIFE